MTSRIFAPNPTAPRRAAGDVVARFRSGHQLNGKPISLSKWRVTTDDLEVGRKLAELLDGGEPEQWETKGDDDLETFTEASSVDIILDPANAIDAHFNIWPRGQRRIVRCDGEVIETDGKKPVECTSGDFSNKKEFEAEGHSCQPQVRVRFKLAADDELGLMEFQSGAWSLVTEVGNLLYQLGEHDGPVNATLALEKVEFESGGETIRFTKPVITIGEAVA